MRFADYDDEDDEDGELRYDYREPRRPRRRRRDHARADAFDRDAMTAREEFGEVHARLDRLTHQLERIARAEAPRLTGAPGQLPRVRSAPPLQPLPRARSGNRPPAFTGTLAIDAAVAEINARQRTLYGEAPAAAPIPEAPAAAAIPPSNPEPSEPSVDLGNLGDQLRTITARIETLRPTSDFERVIAAIREDLAEIRRQLTEARPRHDVESLELEVQALSQRINHSRGSGVDPGEVSRLERGLAEVRDALRGLTPAESLVGFEDAVRTLSQKVDLIVAKEDPATLQQLETAIGALRGIVSHVASNDTLNKVAEDVRSLAAKIDGIANSGANGHVFAMLEGRIDTLTNALNASAEAGHTVPRELEKLLSGLVEKLERAQLTQTDHTALGNLEDRIAQLMKRLDASDARLGNLGAIERGLADLLVHLDQIRGGNVAEIERSERRTQDSLEAVHGTVEQMIGRLAMIESDIHDGVDDGAGDNTREEAPRPVPALKAVVEAAEPAPAKPVVPPVVAPMPAPAPAAVSAAAAEPAPRRTGAPRKPIDPNLPPDHPLEPGFSAHARPGASAADRIAASEAAADYAKPPVIAEPEDKPNFIAAARRAARAATAMAPGRQANATVESGPVEKPQSRLRKFLVAGAAVLIAVGCVHIALHMFEDTGSAVAPPPPKEQTSPPAVLPETNVPQQTAPQPGPLVLPIPGVGFDIPPATKPTPPQNAAPNPAHSENPAPTPTAPPAPPAVRSGPAAPANSSRQSTQRDPSDITGSLPRSAPPPIIAPAQSLPDSAAMEKLPATIGGPTLRAAALAGDSAAEFEVATRFLDGHGVPPSNELAARWLERAARQGLAPAQFRLGGFYEKGIGVKKDLAAARDLYRAAADKGNGKAMHNLAVLYAEGINGPADYRSAAQWFRKAAERGITDSQFNLAILYARGIGVEQNFAESYKWFLLAADQGDSEAAKKRDEIASHLDTQSLAAAQAAIQNWTPQPQPEDAINVKSPPGGWEPQAQSAKSKPRPNLAPSATVKQQAI